MTRALAAATPAEIAIVATDLNPAMLERAAATGTSRPVEWRQADAMQLPFPDNAFELVVCQFGAMFFPDKARAFAEARRVLAPGGAFVFNVWDKMADNEFTDVVTTALESVFPDDPPRFMERTPHGYHDRQVIERDLAGGGFERAPEDRRCRGGQPGPVRAHRGARLLSGDAAAQRDRGARCLALGRGHRHRRGGARAPFRGRRDRRPHARVRGGRDGAPDLTAGAPVP